MTRGLFSAFFGVLLFGTLLAVAVPAAAQPRRGHGEIQPLDKLLPRIRRQHPGNVYDAQGPTPGPNGDPSYRLKWMTPDGRVIWLDTDARNGRVLDASPEQFGHDRDRYRYGPGQMNPRAGDFGRRR